MTSDLFDEPEPAKPRIERDSRDRPLVLLPDGSKRMAYTRCTTFIGCIEDQYRLHLWKQRLVALGLADRPDLLVSVAAHRDDKEELNRIVEAAKEAAKGSAAARTGTALHALAERHDRGETVSVPPAYAPDIEAYKRETACLTPVLIEQFCVQDKLRVGGTFDRLVRYVDHNGKSAHYIADIKTGGIDFGHLKHAMQFAVYANSVPYDIATHKRFAYPDDLDLTKAILIHLPQGEGRCELHWVDIAAGWDAVQIAKAVRAWRNRRHLLTPFTDAAPPSGTKLALLSNLDNPDQIRLLIRTRATPDSVRLLYREAVAAGIDGDSILDECKRRVAALERNT